MHRPRVRSYDGHEVALPTWRAAQAEDWLGRWAMNLMLINVSTRKLRRAVRLPEGDMPVITGDGTSKSAASRRFVALSAERLAEWMASDLSKLDLLVIQIDGLHIGNDLVLVAALGVDGEGRKHPLALIEGATENAAVVQALIIVGLCLFGSTTSLRARRHTKIARGVVPALHDIAGNSSARIRAHDAHCFASTAPKFHELPQYRG